MLLLKLDSVLTLDVLTRTSPGIEPRVPSWHLPGFRRTFSSLSMGPL